MSADVDVEETWGEFFETNKSIPVHSSRTVDNTGSLKHFPFCITLKSIEIDFKSQVETNFQIRITFYDAANHCFFGSTWIGSIVQSKIAENGLHIITINEPLYFHTSVKDYTTVAAIELVDASADILETIGWSWVRIFSQYESLTDTDETARPQERRLTFYYGSPMALLYSPEPIEECEIPKLPNCTLLYILQTHDSLAKVIQYVPENVVINGDDIIPGVAEDVSEENGLIDILHAPQSLPMWPCHLTKLSITLSPSIEKFEEHLCLLLNQDRLSKDDVQPDSGVVSIVERKLKVGVHNGWQFISPLHIVYLEKEYNQSPTKTSAKKNTLRPGSNSSNLTKECVGLVLRSRLELNEMIRHPLFAIAFQLEYVAAIPTTQPELPTGKKARNKLGSSFGSMPLSKKMNIAVRLAIWVPFENGSIGNKNISLELTSGLSPNPFNSMMLSEINDFAEDLQFDSLGKIEFSLLQTKLKKTNEGSIRVNSTSTIREKPALAISNFEEKSFNISDFNALEPITSKPPIYGMSQQQQGKMTSIQIQETQHLAELPRSQLYTPLVVTPYITNTPIALSRVAHSLLHTVEYPQIKDTQGNYPFIVDPQEVVKYDLLREGRDPLHANEIIFQFLAVSRCDHRTVFFTFQFYRFPQTTTERLHLKHLDGTEKIDGTIPCVLQKSARDGNPSTHSPPGLMIKYTVDPSFMQPGEKISFLKYLHQQKLYIDMWDGDSLLLIGSTSIDLKFLLRQGQSAVQISQEVDVIFSEYSEDSPILSGDIVQSGQPHPTGIKTSLQAKLFFRYANVGCLPDTNLEKLNQLPLTLNATVVPSNTTMITSAKNLIMSQKNPARSTARLMSDCDSELATVLLTRKQDTPGRTQKMKDNDANAIRKRKIERMQAVRQLNGGDDLTSSFVLQKEEKIQRTRDLRTIQLYRDKIKSNDMLTRLEEGITTHHMIHSSLGRAEFFEFALKNPYPTDQSVLIKTDDKELSVIINCKEWRYHKQLTDIQTAMEDQMFTSSTEAGVKLFLRASERVHVPFKFQCVTSQNITPEMGPSHPLYTQSNNYSLQTFGKDTTLSSKEIKVLFLGNENKPLSILVLHVELHPHTIDQTFRFYQPEQTFLKKAIRLPPWHTLPGSSVNDSNPPLNVTARCSDNGAICETHQVVAGEPQEVFVKAPCGLSPCVKRFFIIIYIDEFCAKPCQVWQFYVHSLQRVDISATEGQSSKLSILLKGTQSSRMVKCFTSHPAELRTSPRDHFMLMANGVQELSLSLNAGTAGKRMMFVNVVDQEFHQLVKSWLVMATCNPPVISKAFEVSIKVGGGAGSNKKISFLNPYPVKKNFYFKSNREDLLKFKEDGIMLGGGETHNIGLCFLPQQSEGAATILIFINDRDGKNEETFCIKVNYNY